MCRAMGHYVKNMCQETLTFLEMFRSLRFMDVSLAQWLALTVPELMQAHRNMDHQAMIALSKGKNKHM